MNDFIDTNKLISEAKKQGVNFGKGDPYNRLRYYTKMGWLPNMKRIKDEKGDIKGHYPIWSIERLVLIEKLKDSDLPNNEIAKRLGNKNKIDIVKATLLSKESRNQILLYLSLLLLIIVITNELGFISLGKTKSTNNIQYPEIQSQQILNVGTAFVPKDQTNVFVKAKIDSTSKVNITFTQNYEPATRYWVDEIRTDEGFLLRLDAPVFTNSEFNWWVSK